MTTASTFGSLLRETRLARGMSMGQLASSVGRTAASVRRWERDEVVPPAEVLEQIASVLELDQDRLSDLASTHGEVDREERPAAEDPFEGMSGGETGAMALPPVAAPTTLSEEVTPQEDAAHSVRYYLDHLFDPELPYLGYLRAALTVIVCFVLLWILVWAVRELFSALDSFFSQFSREDTEGGAQAVLRFMSTVL